MRSISWLIFSLGLGVFLSSGSAGAQDAVKPSVQVVIGPDGSVKVIDPKTGKEVPSVVTKLPAKPAAAPAKELQIHLELAHFELEKLLNAHAKQKKDAKDGPAVPFRIELEFVPTTGGEPKVIQFKPKIVQVPAKPATVDQKLDLLLKQMDELRGEVHQLKAKLDGKQPDFRPGPPWMMKPGPAPEKDTIQALQEFLKKLEAESKAKKADAPKQQPKDRNAEIEQRLERILLEAEALRKEIMKSKTAPKK